MNGIVLRGFRVKRGGFAVGPIDLKVDDGERALIYGPNGSGKTTILLGIIGAVDSDGSVSVAGQEISHLPIHERGVSYVPAQPVLPGWIVVNEMLRMAGRRETAVDLLERFDLGWALNRPTNALSTGERKLVQILVALSSDTKALLLDEPFSNLSRNWASRLEELLRSEPRPTILTHHERIPKFDKYVRLPLAVQEDG
ncbi:ATP-binding cassette domain-containing protein [Conexivisphaera calida]|uniref:ABC transporter ATP-binding protein n=1 Tax=Conexivisphaera calida TaxID=1874277 RepID=A0A4P2VAC4_9ARCH|nr:ATP-binding cassette domain-containing protein [Conexivisphaera calida]BBE41424.1 ABC transporter ATP-binding protein [Conexivisphaera calida]